MKIALIISIFLQFIAAGYAVGLIRKTKYNISWALISIAFLFMAGRRVIDLIPYLDREYKVEMEIISKWIGVITSGILVIAAFFIRKIFIFIDRINVLRNKSEKRILNAIVQTEEKERRRFAKELHDGLGPLLSTVKMSASALSTNYDVEANKRIIINLNKVTNEAISSLKEISNNLSPHVLQNFGLASATSSFIQRVNTLKGLEIGFEHNIENERFAPNFEIVIYRIICELITNTIRHADAKFIDIKVHYENDLFKLTYTDDGIGFDANYVINEESSGMGYSNISSRLKSLNGFILLNTAINEGVKIQISVPVEK